MDTKGWTNLYGEGCEKYQKIDDPGCPNEGNSFTGDMGPASENCCYCKNPTVRQIYFVSMHYVVCNF